MINKLKIRGKNGDVEFFNLIMDENGDLVFTGSTFFTYSGLKYKYVKDEGLEIVGLGEDRVVIKLYKNDCDTLNACKKEFASELTSLYKDIVNGVEKLVCFETGLEDYPYHITTRTVLDKGIRSPKYIAGMLYAFSDECLNKYNIAKRPDFKDYADFQKRMGNHIKENEADFPKTEFSQEMVVETTLKDLLEGFVIKK